MPNSSPSSLTTYLRLLKYLSGLTAAFATSIVGYLLFAATQPMLAKLMEYIIEAIESQDGDARWLLASASIGIFIIRGFGSFLGDYFNEYVGASVIKKLKVELFDHLTTLPASFYDKSTQGNLLHQLNNGVMRVQALVTKALKTLIKEGLTVIALLVYVFYLNWQLSLIFLLIAPVLGLLVSSTGKKFKSIARKTEGATGKALQVSKELMGNYHVVRGFGAEDYELARYKKSVDRIYKMNVKITKISAIFTPLSQVTVASAVAFIIFLLLTPSVLASSSTGELVGYLTAVALIPKPIRQLTRVSVIIQRGLVGAELVFSLLDKEAENDTGTLHLDKVTGKIEVKGLTFKYPGQKKPALQNINLTIEPGEMVALVGKSGSGKSTLANLLCRVYDAPDNAIFLDDTDINQYKLANLRSHIAAVDQNISLFDDTVKNNIAYGDENYSDEDIRNAASNAQALGFIDKLPEGFQTLIGEGGTRLSGGQRQRLAIARAFLKDSPVLIMDEATSALDNESEEMVTKAVETLATTRTTIVIAHRLSTVERADRIVVMDEGNIIEAGTHSDLLSLKSHFHTLFTQMS